MYRDRYIRLLACGLSLGLLIAGGLGALPAQADSAQLVPARPAGQVMVPDRFLRRWDPVTFFFSHDVGPAGGGPEDHPSRFISVTPAHPGTYTWLNAHTLQYRPEEPWPPLTRFEWRFNHTHHSLVTLFAPPLSTIPANGASDLAPVKTLTLTFAEPVDVKALARMLSIEVQPNPGVGHANARRLAPHDYDIKAMPRTDVSGNASYVVMFHQPIPMGTHVTVHMRLSLEDRVGQSFANIHFSTAAPFTATSLGCGSTDYPLTPSGSKYGRDQAIRCPSSRRAIDLGFSSRPQVIDAVKARSLIRFTPTVSGLKFANAGNDLTISGDFKDNTLYRVDIEPARLKDVDGRKLKLDGVSQLYLYFPRRADFLRWTASQGIVERYGPQMVPLQGRGYQRLDLRIYKINPLNRSFWPFPDRPVVVDESRRPPGPGEAAAPHTDASNISYDGLRRQLRELGSPSISTLVKLPLKRGGSGARFGLDLKPYLKQISGNGQPGTYLVGVRKLDSSSERAWIRVQVTNLALSTVDESDRVRFVVTSLRSGKPVANAHISIQGTQGDQWITIGSGTTDGRGELAWNAPGLEKSDWSDPGITVQRIVVRKGHDVLVLDASRPPQTFAHDHWYQNGNNWLQWTVEPLEQRQPQSRQLCHTFTERPVYKPTDPVYIKGYVRSEEAGVLSPVQGKGSLVVDGPGGMEWRYKVTLSGDGSFYKKFDEKKLPTGAYQVHFENTDGTCPAVTFHKEAFRLPRFKVDLHGPQTASLDRPFKVLMDAKYYAGGEAAQRPVQWRVTQFPYNWAPKRIKGYYYSTDARFSGAGVFQSSPALEKTATTDKHGVAELSIDPTIEPTAQPRRYVIESTVTGADDQTVTNTQEVMALPPFVLGMKVARYLPKATSLRPQIIAEGPTGKLLKGKTITLRLLRRQWHSHLQASDFTQGDARYVTNVVDKLVYKTTLTSGNKALQPVLPLKGAGVYIVEISASDRLGRTQTLRVDLFAGGSQAVTWSKPPTQVFTVATDKPDYAVGETAKMILESPFQEAHALAIVEKPDGHNSYHWVQVHHGSATFKLKIQRQYLPRIPVHFLLLRGRVGGAGTTPRPDELDLGKPVTLATTKWVKVSRRDYRVKVDLSYPHKSLPGKQIKVKIHLHDYRGRPLSGHVTLWLVDQAVLALGKERPLDPLPDFIVGRGSHVHIRDTRNLTLGWLPFQKLPGGGGGGRKKSSLLDKVTIRKDFKPVPFYASDIEVGADGNATVKIKLPDNLTNFKLRAVVDSGADRFGYATGMIAVRLPVIVQPSLPRFVRPGDVFTAVAIGRIVEGKGGPGQASIRVDGLKLDGPSDQKFDWKLGTPQRIAYQLKVPTPRYDVHGRPLRNKVEVTLGVERMADKTRDAFQVKLPLRPDRRQVVQRLIKTLKPGATLSIPAVTAAVRPHTFHRHILLSDQPALIRMAAGLSYLMGYPYGCTEQRISRARVMLASKRLDKLLQQPSNDHERSRIVKQTLDWIGGVVGDDGLAGFWPGSQGYVTLTAWAVQFMVTARDAGFQIDDKVLDRMTDALQQALGSDDGDLIDGDVYDARVWALAALTSAGKFDPGYAAELARRSDYLNLESAALLTRVLADSSSAEPKTLAKLDARMWGGIVIRLYHGKEIYGGLQSTAEPGPGEILPSETRTLAQVLRAVVASEPHDSKRKQLLLNALTTLGTGDGWGTTNANAAALLALGDFLSKGSGGPTQKVVVTSGDHRQAEVVGGNTPLQSLDQTLQQAVQIAYPTVRPAASNPFRQYSSQRADASGVQPVVVRSVTRYLPKAPGSEQAALADGFVVSRDLLKVALDSQVPDTRIALDKPGRVVKLKVGDVIEQHVVVVNPEDRHYVAIVVPLAAGMEPLNPALATAPPYAKPNGQLTETPTYVAYLDDHMAYYYNTLAKGTYDFYFRTRATIPGSYTEPAAYAQMMYKDAVYGNSNGARVVIGPAAASK